MRFSLTVKVAMLSLVAAGMLLHPTFAQIRGPAASNTTPAEPAKAADRPIRLNVEMALANVTVTDPSNRLVTGLDKDNFRVFEDGVEQEVLHFSSEDVPISIGVIFDMSGSMLNKVGKARQAVIEFLRIANPRDEFFLVSFNDHAEMTSSFTSDVEEIQDRMLFTVAKGSTALLDGIYLGLNQMRDAKNARRALLVISDGGDNHSRYSEGDVRKFLKEADCQLYAIGIFDTEARSREEFYGPVLLGELTEMTGGRVFTATRPDDLPNIATAIGMELRNQYLVGYRPSNNQHGGAWRKIKVRLNVPKGMPPLHVYAKTGYYAPNQ
jgi:Ca-activated chloride channel homolog